MTHLGLAFIALSVGELEWLQILSYMMKMDILKFGEAMKEPCKEGSAKILSIFNFARSDRFW